MKPYLLTTDDFHSPEEKSPGLGKPIRPDPFNAKQPALIPIDKKKGIYQDETGKLQTLIPENEKARFPVNQDCALGERPASGNNPISASEGWIQHSGRTNKPAVLYGQNKDAMVELRVNGAIYRMPASHARTYIAWSNVQAWRFV